MEKSQCCILLPEGKRFLDNNAGHYVAELGVIRQGKASMERMGALMQMMSDPSSQYQRLPFVDMPLLRDFAPYYFEWLAHPNYDDYWKSLAHKEYYEQITMPALNIGGCPGGWLCITSSSWIPRRPRLSVEEQIRPCLSLLTGELFFSTMHLTWWGDHPHFDQPTS